MSREERNGVPYIMHYAQWSMSVVYDNTIVMHMHNSHIKNIILLYNFHNIIDYLPYLSLQKLVRSFHPEGC